MCDVCSPHKQILNDLLCQYVCVNCYKGGYIFTGRPDVGCAAVGEGHRYHVVLLRLQTHHIQNYY